ncbi:MAG TPA: hypothetical protein V6D33_12105 [Cyanophyceae cyanobacterium]
MNSGIRSFHQEARRIAALERINANKGKKKQPAFTARVRIASCEVCKTTFKKRWHGERKFTCGKPECVNLLRSLRQRGDRWFQPRVCEYPPCCNFLDPQRGRSQQDRFCSVRCAARSRIAK